MARVVLLTIRNQLAFGPRILHRLLAREGHSVTSLFIGDHFLDAKPLTAEQVETAAAWLADQAPDLLGISLTSYAFQDAKDISAAVRRRAPRMRIVWGGHHPTIAARECVAHCDWVCRGEGEQTLLALVSSIDKGCDPSEVQTISNLSWNQKGFYRENPVAAVEQDLDVLPTPDFSNRDKVYMYGNSLYEVDAPYDDTHIYYTMTSRGCPYKCSFCCVSYMKDMYDDSPGRYLRRRSVESVMVELEEAKRNHPSLKYVYFFDDVFVWDRSWVTRFSEQYRERIGLPFWCYGYVNLTREPLLIALQAAGLEAMSMGIQSGSERVRQKIYDRPESDRAVLTAAELVNRLGIRVTWDLICGPFETAEDKTSAFELFYKLPRPFRFHYHPLSYYRNLGVTQRALSMGLITNNDVVGSLRQLTQGVTDFESWRSTRSVIEDPWYRLLGLFGFEHIPTDVIRGLVGADRQTVESFVQGHDLVAPPEKRIFSRWSAPELRDDDVSNLSSRRGMAALDDAPQAPALRRATTYASMGSDQR